MTLCVIYSTIVLMCTTASAADLTLTVDPKDIQVPFTKTFHLRCSLNESAVSTLLSTTAASDPHIVGRSVPETDAKKVNRRSGSSKRPPLNDKTSTLSDDPVLRVASMTITRDSQQIATVSQYTPAVVESDVDRTNLRVSGGMSGSDGSLGYLDLEWTLPTEKQVGGYECKAVGITQQGHAITFTETVTVFKAAIFLDDIIMELQDLKKTVYEQQQTIGLQQGQIANQSAEVRELKADLKESNHVESGFLDCNDSASWSTTSSDEIYHSYKYFERQRRMNVAFKSDFVRPPVVFLSISNLYIQPLSNIEYAIQVLNVTSQGFTMRCGVNDEAWFHVNDMEVTWMAVAS